MAKFGVGVGEEFPVDEPPQGEPSRSDRERACGWRDGSGNHRFGWVHFTLHILFRVAIIALIAAAAWSLSQPHNYAYPPQGYSPYHRHFFPFFPILLLLFVVAFAWRRRGWHHRHHHWHDGPHHDHRGEA